MKCSKCGEKTTSDSIFGPSPYCRSCQDKLSSFRTKVPEFVGEEIKTQREMYSKDIVQPHRKGELSKEWLDVSPSRKDRAKKMGFSDQEIKNAKYVWSGDDTSISYYKKYT